MLRIFHAIKRIVALPALVYQWRDRNCPGISFSRQVTYSPCCARWSPFRASLCLCHFLDRRVIWELGVSRTCMYIYICSTPPTSEGLHTGANMLHECMRVPNGLLGGGVSGPIHPAVPNPCIASLLFLICLTQNLSFQIINFYLFSRLHLIYAFQLLSQIILYVIGFFFFCFLFC